MKIQRDKLRQYQKKIQAVLDREHQVAREMVAKGDNARALLALRRRKYQEQLLVKTDGQLQALEELVRVLSLSFFFFFSFRCVVGVWLRDGWREIDRLQRSNSRSCRKTCCTAYARGTKSSKRSTGRCRWRASRS